MNRQLRRQNKIQKKPAKYNLSLEQIQDEINKKLPEITKTIEYESISSITAVLLVCLHDEFGFGRVRLQRLLDRFHQTYDALNTDESLNIQDFYTLCLEEFGINIRKEV